MQMTTRKVLNRRIDQDIITALDDATNQINSGTPTTMSLSVVAQALTTLGENEVQCEDEDNMWALASPAVRGYLMQIPEFTSVDYVEMKTLSGKARRVMRFAGFNWIFH